MAEMGAAQKDVKVDAAFWNAQSGQFQKSAMPSTMVRSFSSPLFSSLFPCIDSNLPFSPFVLSVQSKRKHQINSLAFDTLRMRSELATKRAQSMLTKRETQARYGW